MSRKGGAMTVITDGMPVIHFKSASVHIYTMVYNILLLPIYFNSHVTVILKISKYLNIWLNSGVV